MKTLTKISALLLGLGSLAGTSRSQVQLVASTEFAPDGSQARYLRIAGHIEGEAGSYAFLIAGSSRLDYALPGGSSLWVMPELIVPLGEFSSDMAGIWLPAGLPEGILVQALVMSSDGSSFRTSEFVEPASADPVGGPRTDGDTNWLKKSFKARLTMSSDDPPYYSLHVQADVPTGGFTLTMDRIDWSPKGTVVFFRVEAPGSGEVVTDAFERLEARVDLGPEVGERVSVMVAMVRRDSDEAPRYEEYALLDALNMTR
ncbi:MAG: hypothetical protein ACE5F1_00780 [Planctomycetota bacterium]